LIAPRIPPYAFAMNTQTHALMGAALFGRGVPARAWIGVLGGVLPDIPMLAIVAALKIAGVPNEKVFGEMYWQNWWQVTNAIGHSFLLWGALLILGFAMRGRGSPFAESADRWTLLAILAGAALIHSGIDFLCHREDAHMNFWPLSRWKFVSPVSYWDWRHYGRYFAVFETVLGLAMAALLFRQYANWIVRGLLAVAMLAYAAVPAYFILG
jgi:LexA-binding, inner membrane-associated putative hydrolase